MIFGASGDLTRRLLIPSLCNLHRARLLAERFSVIGVSRTAMDDDAFRRSLIDDHGGGRGGGEPWGWLAERLHYLPGDFDDPATYERLALRLEKLGARNALFYLAVPATLFVPVVQCLGAVGLVREQPGGGWRRVIIEKPFGSDLPSAQRLNRELLQVLEERQIYRIDHYLGKETVQNIMVLRFANGLFEPLWNREHIDHVQITVAEALGVEHRGRFYDATGALRDMVPNHLFQLFTLVAMAPPGRFEADAVHWEKVKVLDGVHPFGEEDALRNVVRAQYGEGEIGGRRLEAYRRSPDVARESRTETYVALKLMMDNWRWARVPFYLRTGKALRRRRSEVVIQFKQAPLAVFRDTPVERLTPNDLVLSIQPEEGVLLRFNAKVPGPSVRSAGVGMRFDYHAHFAAPSSTGYETLIYDAMIGDALLFQRADNIEAGWRVVQPLLESWARDKRPLPVYAAGSEGPREADALIERDGRHWRPLGGDA